MFVICGVILCFMMVTAATNVNMQYDSASLLSLRPPLNAPLPAKFIMLREDYKNYRQVTTIMRMLKLQQEITTNGEEGDAAVYE